MTVEKKRPLKQLVDLAKTAIRQIQEDNDPAFQLPVRGLTNAEFDAQKGLVKLGKKTQVRQFFNAGSAKSYMQTFLIIQRCKELLETKKTTSIRDVYYMTKHTIEGTKEETFTDQTQSDTIIEDLEITLGLLRENFGLFASSRGAMVGELTIQDSGDNINLRKQGSGGWAIPGVVEPYTIKFKQCNAKFILVVEKDASFRRLNEDKFWADPDHKCILLHGQGMPPRGARRLIHRMHKELKLPVYVLTDNDPWGIYIYSVIRSGSMNLAFESERMAVPRAKWLGIRSSDFYQYKLPKTCTIALDQRDLTKLKQMANYPWMSSVDWQRELKKMRQNGFKLEIEALASKGLGFLSTYLAEKIRRRAWLG